MVPKQQEMDAVVKQIYEAMATKDYLNSTLLVLLGDHGMNDAGNHGGSAPGRPHQLLSSLPRNLNPSVQDIILLLSLKMTSSTILLSNNQI